MKEDITNSTKSKLDDKLEDKRSIKFTDYAINK